VWADGTAGAKLTPDAVTARVRNSLDDSVLRLRIPGLFPNVLKKFFTGLTKYENNMATSKEIAMKAAVKTLLSHNPRGAVEDLVGLAALFVLLFAVLSLPGLT
jgi:hypothetical protein